MTISISFVVIQVGLCQNVRNVPWFHDSDPDSFYPRCYKLEECDEREAFIGRTPNFFVMLVETSYRMLITYFPLCH